MERNSFHTPLLPGVANSSLDLAGPTIPINHVPIAPQEAFWATYWLVLRKRKWSIVCMAAIVVIIATIVSLRMRPVYQAAGRIAINRSSTDALLGFKDPSENYEGPAMDINTQVKILQSNTIALMTAKALHLDGSTVGNGPAPGPASSSADPARKTSVAEEFRHNLTVSPVPDTRLIEVAYSSHDPQFAARAVNTLLSIYVEQNIKTKFDSTTEASDWLSTQLNELRLKVETSQEKILQYQRENGFLVVDDKQNIVTSKLDDLNRELSAAEAERIHKQSRYEFSLSANTGAQTGADPNNLLEKLLAQEAELKLQYAKLSTEYGPNYFSVQELDSQIKQTEASIQAERNRQLTHGESEYKAALEHEKMLRAAFETQKLEANRLNEKAVGYNILKRDYETNRQLYEELLKKMKEASVTAALKSSNLQIVDSAWVPTHPISPNIPRNIGLGLLLGIIGGVGLAFVLEGFDNTVSTPEQIELISALPSLGMIPLNRYRHSKNGRGKLTIAGQPSDSDLVTIERPQSEVAESFRALRTSVLLSCAGAPPKVILITSPLPREGKTTTCLNFAIVLAQKGGRILLIDADLRLAGIHHALGLPRSPGLSGVLAGSDTLENAIVPSLQLPNLFVLPAGPRPPDPAELLSSTRMKDLLETCRQQFDHVVIDTPPVLSVTDPVALSVEADVVVLMVRSGQSTKNSIRRAQDLLAQVNARVLGIAVNAVDLQSPDLYYYYGGYASKHGSRYYTDGSSRAAAANYTDGSSRAAAANSTDESSRAAAAKSSG